MKRINITYDGKHYSIGEMDTDVLKATIEKAYHSGTFQWLVVNEGEGRPQRAEILIGPGIPIALTPVGEDTEVPS